MAVKLKSNGTSAVKTKAKEVLAFARKQLRECKSAAELFVVIFGPHGKAKMMFPSKRERASFERSAEFREIERLIRAFGESLASGGNDATANGGHAVTLRLPIKLHQALIVEAAAEEVSLDQLCLSKLVAQLRKLM